VLSRVTRTWRALASEQRLAAIASLLLFVTMFLPWYQQNVVVSGTRTPGQASENLSAFGVFSFVEAAVLLVAVAVLVLLYARANGRAFHLPGGDGTIVMIAGGWVVLLLVWRLFDKPDLQGNGIGNMGIQWGIFFALCAAGLLTLAGTRMRAAHRPEPPIPEAEAYDPEVEAARAAEREHRARERRRRAGAAQAFEAPEPATDVTRPLVADPPTWELPDPPTQRMRERERDRGEPQTERLFDEG
jgi:hypothetical protein